MEITYCPSKTLAKFAHKNAHKIREVAYSDDFNYGSAYDILLERGWCSFDEPGLHTIIEYTVKDAMAQIRAAVKCTCDDCITGAGW